MTLEAEGLVFVPEDARECIGEARRRRERFTSGISFFTGFDFNSVFLRSTE